MSKAYEQILGHVPLTTALRVTASGVPNPFPEQLFAVREGNRVLGDMVSYLRVFGERRPAKKAMYGSPAKRRNLRPISDQKARCVHNLESFPIDALMLQKFRAFESYEQDGGRDFLKYQFDEAGKRAMNARIVGTASVLRSGEMYWDSDDNALPTSSGADSGKTVSFNVPATHQGQIDGIIGASWALSNTDIPGHIRNLQQFAAQETGMALEDVLYGINVPKYMTQNAYVSDYLARGDARDKFLATGEIPDGLFGLNWHPVYRGHFLADDDSTVKELWDDDLAVFMPSISQPDKMDWWAMYEGSFQVPKSIDIQRDAMAALGNLETVYGMFSYAIMNWNPPGFEVFHGDTWLPGLRNEKAIYQADVAF